MNVYRVKYKIWYSDINSEGKEIKRIVDGKIKTVIIKCKNVARVEAVLLKTKNDRHSLDITYIKKTHCDDVIIDKLK